MQGANVQQMSFCGHHVYVRATQARIPLSSAKADDLNDTVVSMLQTAAACRCQGYNRANSTG